MVEIVVGYILIGLAILIPVALLAGFVYVLLRPLGLEEVNRRHADAHAARDRAPAETPAESSPTPPGRPRRVA